MPGPRENQPLTFQRLLEVLSYDALTGVFVWKVRQARNTRVGGPAGGKRRGTFYVRIDEVDYPSARVAWFYVTGQWPHRLKFKDGDKANIRFANLAETNALPEKFDATTPEGRAAYLKLNRERYSDVWRGRDLQAKFGLSLAEYDAKHDAQNGVCAICGEAETGTRLGKTLKLAVDHNHTTGVVRDLLCRGCNQLIGNAYEDIAVLEAAIAYLRKHNDVPAIETQFYPHHTDLMLH